MHNSFSSFFFLEEQYMEYMVIQKIYRRKKDSKKKDPYKQFLHFF